MSHHTKHEIRIAWRCGASVLPPTDLVIPAGTRCRLITEGGTAGKFWIDDLAWFPEGLPTVKHDAEHYGIVIEPDQVEPPSAPAVPRGTAIACRADESVMAEPTCPDCGGEDFRGEGAAQVCRECGTALWPTDDRLNRILDIRADLTTLPACGDVWWVDDNDDIRDENRLRVDPHQALRRLREAQIMLVDCYQALYAVPIATGDTLYELLHTCEVFEADPEPLADLLERLQRMVNR